MNKRLADAIHALNNLDTSLKPVQLGLAREETLVEGLHGLAAEYDREIEPTHIDANGEMVFVMLGSAQGRGLPYGPELAAWLNTISVRTGIHAIKGCVQPECNWRRINHFEVERLLKLVGTTLGAEQDVAVKVRQATYNPDAWAPISTDERVQLKTDAQDILATAKRKDIVCEREDLADEIPAARDHFELGCWLYYYSKRVGTNDGLQDRIECARRLFDAGIQHPGYRFYTVFEFGERQFDTIFEMGDADQVIAALRDIAIADPKGGVARAFPTMGWPLAIPQKGTDADLAMAP